MPESKNWKKNWQKNVSGGRLQRTIPTVRCGSMKLQRRNMCFPESSGGNGAQPIWSSKIIRSRCTKSKENQRYIFNDQPEDCTNGIMFFSFLHIYIMFSHLPMPLPFQLSLPVFPLLILRVLPCRIHPHSQHHGRYI